MENQFVPYGLSLKLKDIGFNEKCIAIWALDFPSRKAWLKISSDLETIDDVTAPLWQQVFDWFREEYRYDLSIIPMTFVGHTCYYDIHIQHPSMVWDTPPKVTGKTYTEAREACLLKLISLIEQS